MQPLPSLQDITIKCMSRCDCLSGRCNWIVFLLRSSCWNSGSDIDTNFPHVWEPHCEWCLPCQTVSLNSALPSIKKIMIYFSSDLPSVNRFYANCIPVTICLTDWVFFSYIPFILRCTLLLAADVGHLVFTKDLFSLQQTCINKLIIQPLSWWVLMDVLITFVLMWNLLKISNVSLP